MAKREKSGVSETKPQRVHADAPRRQNAAGSAPRNLAGRLLPVVSGIFCGLCLLKFGNPAIMEKWVEAPANIYEFVFGSPWPLHWGYWLLVTVTVVGAATWRWHAALPRFLLILPCAWLLWQFVSAGHSVDSTLTRATLPHLAACALAFYLGLFALSRPERICLFWAGLFAGFLFLLVSAWSQRFGGLEETRRYFWTYVYPTMDVYPTDYIKKISSSRVFGTLFYPNTLAAGIILLFPPLSAKVLQWTGGGRFTPAARGFILLLWAIASLSCLFWSGSKGGWLVLMAVALIGFFRWPGIDRRARLLVSLALILAGLGGFFWTYSAFFKRGAPSVGARFSYWSAALKITNQKPVYGSGPGTFAVPYKQIKAEDSEMSRLVHNDYLQQASDSGVPGFLCYSGFVCAALFTGMRRTRLKGPAIPPDWEALTRFAVWLGLAGWFLHSLIEFNLYVPALAWTAFLLLGWLLGSSSASAAANSGAQSSANV